jgi:hypothetical protein
MGPSAGQATLRMTAAAATPTDAWGSPRPVFDVIAHATLSLSIPANRYGYEGRGCPEVRGICGGVLPGAPDVRRSEDRQVQRRRTPHARLPHCRLDRRDGR